SKSAMMGRKASCMSMTASAARLRSNSDGCLIITPLQMMWNRLKSVLHFHYQNKSCAESQLKRRSIQIQKWVRRSGLVAFLFSFFLSLLILLFLFLLIALFILLLCGRRISSSGSYGDVIGYRLSATFFGDVGCRSFTAGIGGVSGKGCHPSAHGSAESL